ncbi:unnamed protein product, partial [Laminaria digitata]
KSTEVCKHTVDPVWDAEFVFPLEVQSVEDVLSGRLNIRVRDHDDADGDVHYLDLGRVTISLGTVLTEGNIMAHTQLVQLPARWYPLLRCHGMRKSRGALKIAVGFFVGADSVLLRGGDDNSGTLDDNADVAARFEHRMRRIRGYGATTTTGNSGRTVSMSPPARRSPMTSRLLTARGGTTSQRPKSAPDATTLTSPAHLQQRPFELKPVQARFPVRDMQTARASDSQGRAAAEGSGTRVVVEAIASEQHRPRWQDTYHSTEGQGQVQTTTSPSRLRARGIGVPREEEEEERRLQEDQRALLLAKAVVSSPPTAAQHVRSSDKLSRLAARASRASLSGSPTRGLSSSKTWGEEEGATVRAHRWQMRLLECMQRLEARSTEASAYGELRAMSREASTPQVGQVVAAARTMGSDCSLAARRYTLRLLAWLCWDQPRAAGRFCDGIVEYALDRVRDEETASLCRDLALCVGAVMLSALRSSSADASMAQTRRFLRLVGEQRASVRVAAGACCAAAVLPPPFPVLVQMETHVRGIEDVRLAVGKAMERVGIANTAVPKEAVLLPGGRALIELADARVAAEFFDRISVAAGDLPRNWSVDPFPEDFCAEIKLAEAAHHARLTVNSEEILACLVESLDSGRSEGTRAELFNAVAAMANSCANHGHPPAKTSDEHPAIVTGLAEKLSVTELSAHPTGIELVLGGMSATLRKGLPAIAHAVSVVLDCPVRRAFAWKERKAALDLIVALAVLRDLGGPEGPLGEHRLRLIQGATRGKRDSVAAVREAAVRSLEALGATTGGGAEDKLDFSQETRNKPIVSSCLLGSPLGGGGSRGGVMRGPEIPLADTRNNKYHQSGGVGAPSELKKLNEKTKKKKTLDGALRRWEKAADDAAEAAERKIERFREHRDEGRKDQQQRRRRWRAEQVPAEEEAPLLLGETPVTNSTPSAPNHERSPSSSGASSSGDGENQQERRSTSPQKRSPSRGDGEQQERRHPTSPQKRLPSSGDGEHQQERRPTSPQNRSPSVQVSMTSIVPKLEQELPEAPVLGAAAGAAAAAAAAAGRGGGKEGSASMVAAPSSSSLLPPMNGGIQADTARLLQHLCNKTDTIASVLESLGQRVVGMERTLVSQERPDTAVSPTRSSPRRLKRPRSGRVGSPNNAASPKGKLDSTPSFVQAAAAAAPKASVPAELSSSAARSTTRVRRQIALLVRREDFEQAFRLALASGTERDVLRLMGSAGGPDLCRRRLGMETRDRLFAFLARTISSGLYAEHALPWVFELVREGEARALSLSVRMQLAGALHGLAASPTDQGVMAAKLGPYLSLTSVGRSSLADVSAGGGVFCGLEVAGGRSGGRA